MSFLKAKFSKQLLIKDIFVGDHFLECWNNGNFQVRPGDGTVLVALLRSSLINLIQGFYSVQSGQVGVSHPMFSRTANYTTSFKMMENRCRSIINQQVTSCIYLFPNIDTPPKRGLILTKAAVVRRFFSGEGTARLELCRSWWMAFPWKTLILVGSVGSLGSWARRAGG